MHACAVAPVDDDVFEVTLFGLMVRSAGWYAGDPGAIPGRYSLYIFLDIHIHGSALGLLLQRSCAYILFLISTTRMRATAIIMTMMTAAKKKP
jgi:hypothetical protein